MSREVWVRRAFACVAVVSAMAGLAATFYIVDDVHAVAVAKGPEATARPAASRATWTSPKPVLRGAANPATAVNEYLNGQLGPLGLEIISIGQPSIRPLGDGLKLAEMRVEARAEAPAATAVAQWVAVNRDAVRMKSMSLGVGSDGDGVATIVLLVVVS